MTTASGPAQRLTILLREGIAVAASQPVATTVTSLVVAAVCGVILATVGQSAAAEARVLEWIDEAGTRTIIVSDPTGQAVLYADSVEEVEALDGVTWVLGLGAAADVRNADLGAAARPVPARYFYGELPHGTILSGRAPDGGEAVAGFPAMQSLGIAHPAAGVVGTDVSAAIVGAFGAEAPLDFLDRGVLIAAGRPTSAKLRQLYVMAASVDDVDRLIRALPAVLWADAPNQLVIQTPELLVQLRAIVGGELARNSRSLMLLVLGVGLVLVITTLAGAVVQRRRDYGRRRALGATRSMVMTLVLTQTAVGAVAGAVVGCAVGIVVVWRITGFLPSATFVSGVAILALLSALTAGIPPGLIAALRDPVRILRVP